MSGEADATFGARPEELAAAAVFVAAFCERHAIDEHDALRLALIVEEVFSNVVKYAYGSGEAGTVRLALAFDGRDVRIECEDRGPPYDPRPSLARVPADLGDPVETRAVGGLGHWLVGRLVAEAGYVRRDGANLLSLRFRRRVTSVR